MIEFRGFPNLWERYPIPNDIIEFWYNERKDIYQYYLNKTLDNYNGDAPYIADFIKRWKLTPEGYKFLTHQWDKEHLISQLFDSSDTFEDKKNYFSHISSTEVLANNDVFQKHDFILYFNSIYHHLHDFSINHLDKLF